MVIKKFTEESTLADILTTDRGRRIIAEFFGDACMSCPAVKGETLGLSAHFHGVDVKRLLGKLNGPQKRSAANVGKG